MKIDIEWMVNVRQQRHQGKVERRNTIRQRSKRVYIGSTTEWTEANILNLNHAVGLGVLSNRHLSGTDKNIEIWIYYEVASMIWFTKSIPLTTIQVLYLVFFGQFSCWHLVSSFFGETRNWKGGRVLKSSSDDKSFLQKSCVLFTELKQAWLQFLRTFKQ